MENVVQLLQEIRHVPAHSLEYVVQSQDTVETLLHIVLGLIVIVGHVRQS